jgi:hypothetical protein
MTGAGLMSRLMRSSGSQFEFGNMGSGQRCGKTMLDIISSTMDPEFSFSLSSGTSSSTGRLWICGIVNVDQTPRTFSVDPKLFAKNVRPQRHIGKPRQYGFGFSGIGTNNHCAHEMTISVIEWAIWVGFWVRYFVAHCNCHAPQTCSRGFTGTTAHRNR